MNVSDLAANLLSPPILFFMLGLFAALARSDLAIPNEVSKSLSLFLLAAIGFKGGVSLAESGFSAQVTGSLLAAVAASIIVPLWTFLVLRSKFGALDAAAVAATYGSVSAVTFVTAASYLGTRGIPYSGHMVAAMALMESPAIVIGVMLARKYGATEGAGFNWRHLGRDAFLNGSVVLLMGSLLIGYACGPERGASFMPFIKTLFPGMLVFFLLDMGIVAARRMSDLREVGVPAIGFGLLAPPINAALGLGLAGVLGLAHGDALLLVVLCASASYIAVPAALRIALPAANPSLYVTLSLAVTFPLNIVLGIPAYDWIITRWF